MLELLYTILLTAGLLSLGIGLTYGIKFSLEYLKVKVGSEKFQILAGYAERVVRSLEQMGLTLEYSGEEKKAFALSLLRKFADKFSIEYDEELLDTLIEAAVQVMNAEIPTLFEPTTEIEATGK